MPVFVVGLHITLCFFLILVVLLQPGKGADFGAAMGGSSTGSDVFGATGSVSILTKLTAVVAALFMTTSLSLAWFSNAGEGNDLGIEDILEEAGSDVPGATGEADEPGTEVPAEDEGEAAPDEGEAAPDEGEAAPEEDEAAPDEDEAAPDEDEAAPAEGEAAPADEAPSEEAPAEAEAPAAGAAPADPPPADEAPAADPAPEGDGASE